MAMDERDHQIRLGSPKIQTAEFDAPCGRDMQCLLGCRVVRKPILVLLREERLYIQLIT